MKKTKVIVEMIEMVADEGMELVLPDGERALHAFVPPAQEKNIQELIAETKEERDARIKEKELKGV